MTNPMTISSDGSRIYEAVRPTFPYKIKVGPFSYNVQVSDTAIMAHAENGGGSCDAYCQPYKMEIVLKASCVEDRRRELLLHETLHALCDLVQKRALGFDDYDEEEKMVATLAPALLSVLRDNPDMVAYLCSS